MYVFFAIFGMEPLFLLNYFVEGGSPGACLNVCAFNSSRFEFDGQVPSPGVIHMNELVRNPQVWSNTTLKWYYDEKRIFPIEAILKHKQVVCTIRKINVVYYFQISLFVPEIFKFLKYAN